MNNFFYNNINKLSIDNSLYRQVIYTSSYLQIVLMNIPPNDFIHLETHDYVDQYIHINSGNGLAIINNNNYELYENIDIVIPAKTPHKIINNSNTDNLILYTIYSPPNHKYNKKNITNPDIKKNINPDNFNINDIYHKYLKYKNKYNNLKKSKFNTNNK